MFTRVISNLFTAALVIGAIWLGYSLFHVKTLPPVPPETTSPISTTPSPSTTPPPIAHVEPVEPPKPVIPTHPETVTGKIDEIIIDKTNRHMVLMQKGIEVRRYPIGLGFSPKGDKVEQGDGKTPEGTYYIDRRNDKSKYHLSLGLNYPDKQDRQHAQSLGVDPGGDIFIHGQPNQLTGDPIKGDWTAGCIAVNDKQIEEIWKLAPMRTKVTVLP